jgi:hypothetical protein
MPQGGLYFDKVVAGVYIVQSPATAFGRRAEQQGKVAKREIQLYKVRLKHVRNLI